MRKGKGEGEGKKREKNARQGALNYIRNRDLWN